jgi:sarcosine oxidase subunit alpha
VSDRTGRLDVQPGEEIDRQTPLSFTWDGRPYRGFAGDTIASALVAAGVGVFSRSFKYHRPRGLLTATFHDPGCTVQVGDEPNVRGAHRRLEPGMAVRPQNTWPSLRYDVKAANQLVGRFLGAGFYYKTFIRPQRLWPAYQRVLSRFAAGGKLTGSPSGDRFDQRYAHVDVCVAGGGPAGMAAAIAAAEAGARVLLVEEEYRLGGHLRYGGSDELVALAALRDAAASHENLEVMTNAVVAGRYDDNWLAVVERQPPSGADGGPPVFERVVKVRASALVVAPGLIERPYVFEGNDAPGVLLATAVRRLINLWAVRPGERAVVLTANAEGDAAVEDLGRAGVDVVRVVDGRNGGDVLRAEAGGRGERHRVRRVTLGSGEQIDCDLLVTGVGWTAPTALLNLAGDRPVYSPVAARFLPGGLAHPDVLATGGLAGDGSLEVLIDHGRATGREAASRAGRGTSVAIPALPVAAHPPLFRSRTHGMVDFSEDVSSKDVVNAAAEGFDSVELVKRFTTATMGPAQGKLETVNLVAVLAEANGASIESTGTTVWRPPYAPITLGALAGRGYEPVRYSPMQPWHDAHGARPLVAGAWIRPDRYGDPEAEVRNVRAHVGIIDVTPLGKLDLRGPDVPELLNLLYVNRWSKLAVGGVRYGVMCADDGVVLDDGVTGRLGPEHYVMSTTSSGADSVWEWVQNWLQTEHPEWHVHVTPVTTAFASMNVAGPASRDLLRRLTADIDLAPESFPYMQVRQGTVAGVEGCFMWRIGFTGELSYELHVPAAYGLHVWEACLDAGADLGIRAFGVEAQRIMRLEKGHFIVGQDTDGLTQGFAVGLGSLIKLDKEDFAGRPELTWQLERGDYQRLVGLQPLDPACVPPEACQIIERNGGERPRIVGRITSSRMSPTLNRSIGLGFVAPHLCEPGSIVTVRLPDGTDVPVRVMEHHAHVDPEGTRLRG